MSNMRQSSTLCDHKNDSALIFIVIEVITFMKMQISGFSAAYPHPLATLCTCCLAYSQAEITALLYSFQNDDGTTSPTIHI